MSTFRVLFLFLLYASYAMANPAAENEFRALVNKDAQIKANGGSGLEPHERDRMQDLIDIIGPIKSAQITSEVMSKVSDQIMNKAANGGAPSSSVSSASSAPPTQPLSSVINQTASQSPVLNQNTQPKPQENVVVPNIIIVNGANASPNGAPVISGNAGMDELQKVIAGANEPAKKQDEPKRASIVNEVKIDPKSEKELMQIYSKDIAEDAKLSANPSEQTPQAMPNSPRESAYIPPPKGITIKNPNFNVERDATNIIEYNVSTRDSITVYNCFADGVSIHFGDSIKAEIQRVVFGDDKYYTFKEFDNKRGVFARLQKPIKKGEVWVSSMRIVRSDNDKVFLVNLVAIPCPEAGVLKFPKVVYLEELKKRNEIADDELKMADFPVMTPEDTIITMSKGYRRNDRYKLEVHDMVLSAGSQTTVLGVQVEDDSKDYDFVVLDFHQINPIKTTTKFLEIPSKVVSEATGKKLRRYNLILKINKDYIISRGIIHIMYLNNKNKEYEYVRVNLRQYYRSLKEREFEL